MRLAPFILFIFGSWRLKVFVHHFENGSPKKITDLKTMNITNTVSNRFLRTHIQFSAGILR